MGESFLCFYSASSRSPWPTPTSFRPAVLAHLVARCSSVRSYCSGFAWLCFALSLVRAVSAQTHLCLLVVPAPTLPPLFVPSVKAPLWSILLLSSVYTPLSSTRPRDPGRPYDRLFSRLYHPFLCPNFISHFSRLPALTDVCAVGLNRRPPCSGDSISVLRICVTALVLSFLPFAFRLSF